MYLHEGKLYARVSEVIRPFLDLGKMEDDPDYKANFERKGALGTRVHEAIKEEIDGMMPTLEGREQGYFQSWEKWRRALNPKFIQTETRLFCGDKMLTGCIDALACFHGDDSPTLVDWKTSASESPVTWPMQAHLYHYLLDINKIEATPRFLFVKLDRYGDLPKVFQYKFDKNLLSRCLEAVSDFWQKNVAGNTFENV